VQTADIEGDEKAEERSSPLQMKYYRLRQERKSLQAKLIKIKQELAKLRESQTEQEFSALRNSQMQVFLYCSNFKLIFFALKIG